MNLNKISLIGRLGQEPQLKDLPSGGKVCNFSLAVSEKWKDKSGNLMEETQWFNVQVFGTSASHCKQFLIKGSCVYVEGKLKIRSYVNKMGENKHSVDVTGTSIQFLNGKSFVGQTERPAEIEEPYVHQNTKTDFDQNDIPF